MANDTNLYNILNSLYQGEVKINTKLTGAVDHISGVIGTYDKPAEASGTIAARLSAIEAAGGTKVANADNGVNNGLVAGDQTSQGDVSISDGIITVLNAAKVEHKLNAFGFDFDGSASGTLTFGTSTADTISVASNAGALTVGAITGTPGVAADAAKLATAGAVATVSSNLQGVIDTVSGKVDTIALVKDATAADGYAATYTFTNGANQTTKINIPKDQFLKNAAYDAATETINLTFEIKSKDADGKETATDKTVSINVAALVHEYEGSNAIAVSYDGTPSGKTAISLKLDTSTAGTEVGKFLSVTSNGLLLSGVQAAINAANSDALTELHALSGQVSGAFGAGDYLVVSKDGKIEKSSVTIGADADTITSGSAANVVATEKAVAAAIKVTQDKLDALSGNIDDSFVSGQVAIGKADNSGLEASGYTLGGATLATSPAATVLATEAAVKAANDALYTKIVTEDLADLWTKVNAFNTGLGPDVNL